MNTLPLELILDLCTHLTVPDIAHCCAVSRSWRSIFNNNNLWKRYCHKDLDEYLRTTPCVVEPKFVIPEVRSSRLDPICEWRLAYMRQNHLWNNWRTGNFKKQIVISNPSNDLNFHADIFMDYLALIYEERIELWDINVVPARKLSVSYHYIPSYVLKSFKCGGKNWDIIVLNYLSGTQVFRMNEATKIIEMKHIFYFEEDEKPLVYTDEHIKGMFSYQHMYPVPSIAILGSIYVGVIKGNSNNLHVWDLETGVKLREEPCLKRNPYSFIEISSSSTSEDIIVVTSQVCGGVIKRMPDTLPGESLDVLDYHFNVYSPRLLTFLPFSKTHLSSRGYGCAIHKNYVAINVGNELSILNYVTSQVVYSSTLFLTGLDVIDNGIVFVLGSIFHLYNPSVKPRVRMSENVVYFKTVCGNFLLFRKDEIGFPTELWEAGMIVRRTRTELPKSDTIRSNRSCTKLVIKDYIMPNERMLVNILYFW
ncbi:uncharacterized protein LOC124356297 [Homalodisca vitripennis]|uniref:uncharacterized protein LOC124356297 n=1 Tax=Homalodisca vitripennis TaxID=197043 RepID=UPI001EEB15DE|nr:uncharacterized protein LOC124356297 [Homalodisca vitripennis]KAG8333527.1 hypothetical protein J6590_000677 [Homalodisca vitripennis]